MNSASVAASDSRLGIDRARRVALMTWFQYRNYGTALQVSALSRVISGMGFDVDVVDYQVQEQPVCGFSPREMPALLSKAWRSMEGGYAGSQLVSEEKSALFRGYLAESLSFTQPCETTDDLKSLNERYGAFVCGSDQIWLPTAFDPHYYLDFVQDNRLKVAYAPSIGLSDIRDRDVAHQMGELAARIDRLSTREESGSAIIERLTGCEVATVLDPTLLMDADSWRGIAEGSSVHGGGRFLLAYMLGRDERQWRGVYSIARMLGLEVRVIPVFPRDLLREGCVVEPVGPREFVALLDGASFVCTDSFHGVAFSLIFEKDFCAFERFRDGDPGSQNSRVHRILNKTGLQGRLVKKGRRIGAPIGFIDWTEPKERLVCEREASLAWLAASLDGCHGAWGEANS